MPLVFNKVQMIMRCISAAGLLAQVPIVCHIFVLLLYSIFYRLLQPQLTLNSNSSPSQLEAIFIGKAGHMFGLADCKKKILKGKGSVVNVLVSLNRPTWSRSVRSYKPSKKETTN